MGCSGCSTGSGGKPNGCKSNGGCSTGGCNRLNTFDWLSNKNFYDPASFNIVEISFKNGSRKSFFWKDHSIPSQTGDFVVVETGSGQDVGIITLSGDLVRLQMKKKRFKKDRVLYKVLRPASPRDMEKMEEARGKEKESMVRARVISRHLGLNMKIGDVEYQSDQRKATFFYTADGRVDFRELVRQFAKEFRVKVEMRQIGSRQESGKIGGIGSCGRELCCSTWLSDFKSVNTTAARYQNLAINQSKLSGQCGRLKCCLNYELDTYLDALTDFPKHAEVLHTEAGKAILVKTDIFKRLMFYCYEVKGRRGHIMPVHVDTVKKVLEMNANKQKPAELTIVEQVVTPDPGSELEEADITGDFELPELNRPVSRSRKNKKRKNTRSRGPRRNDNRDKKPNTNSSKKTENKGSNSPSKKGPVSPKNQTKGNKQKSHDKAKPKPKPDGNRNKPKNHQNKPKKD